MRGARVVGTAILEMGQFTNSLSRNNLEQKSGRENSAIAEEKAPMTGSNKVMFFASIVIAVGLFLLAIEAGSQNQFQAIIWAYTA